MKQKLKTWYETVSGHDPQLYIDFEWDWEMEILNFISDPDAAIKDAEFNFPDER